ncbi:MAG TPA: putative manganese transporter [Candidatus Cryosericum sp.]|jgi:hypothetical protein|nr:putative manganese transporter [Candidatus Cryosericum sp.]
MNVIIDALKDTLNMAPILLMLYIGFEYVEARWQQPIVDAVEHAGRVGPLVASLGAAIPQCGFSVMASALYTQRLITMGTLVATYLATSDEALPVLLSKPGQSHVVLPLIGVKVVMAVAGGYVTDAVMSKTNRRRATECCNRAQAEQNARHIGEDSCSCEDTRRSCEPAGRNVVWREILSSALRRAAEVLLFVFLTSLGIGLLINGIGQAELARLLLNNTLLQPVLAALIGLIPNCAASVALTELYVGGVITFGSVVAGLGAAGGLGLLVLVRENHDARNTAMVVGWLLGISIATGIVIQLAQGVAR